jgi:Cof subfamily protein (haloacid dehalogenase superfamily)
MIPLVILDLDGTMIGRSGQVSPEVWGAVERARGFGVKVAICTGRPGLGVALRIADRVGPNNPHVFQSGAHVAYPNGRTVRASALKESATLPLVRHAREYNLVLELYTPQHMYVERKTRMSEDHARIIGVQALVRDLGEVVASEPVIRAQWVVDADQEALALAPKVDGVTFSRATSPTLPGTLFISLTRGGVSKGTAVMELAKQLRVPLERTMAVGDTSGDLPMLELVGFPVLMGNAEEHLKERFSTVVADVEHHGVIEALDLALTLKAP